MEFINTYILTWKLPVALAIATLAILPIRNAYRKVRIGDLDMLDRGAVEQAFTATLWIGLASLLYPYVMVLIIGVWFSFMRRHLMTLRAWMSSWLAIALSAFWYAIIYYLAPQIGSLYFQ